MAKTVTADDGRGASTARFALDARTRVLDETGTDVVPGSGHRGRVAVRGHLPIGYYKDPEKTASTFVEIGGERYVVAGDWAEVTEAGEILLLGRGSGCINTGGEKVYPEEVEEALKQHPDIADAAVVGIPDLRFGESVAALVEPHDGLSLDTAGVVAFARGLLAAYKVPRRTIPIASIRRSASGKLDYPWVRQEILAGIEGHPR